MAVRVIASIRDTLNIELPVQVLFEAPTLKDLAKYLEILSWSATSAAKGEAEHLEEDMEEGVI